MVKTETIRYYDLTEAVQKRIDEIENGAGHIRYVHYVRPHGRGYKLASIEENLENLFLAQQGQGWMRVVFE